MALSNLLMLSAGLFSSFQRNVNFIFKPVLFEQFAHGIVKMSRDDQIPETTPPVHGFGRESTDTDRETFGNVLYKMPIS